MLKDFHMTILPRSVAKDINAKYFYTGEPCKHGHFHLRYTKGGGCAQCMRNYNNSPERKEYMKNYEEEHKEYLSEKSKKYREEHGDRLRAQGRKRYRNNKEDILEYQRNYYLEHTQYIIDRVTEYRKQPEVKEKRNSKTRKRYREDSDYWAARQSRRLLYRTLSFTDLSKDSRTSEMLGYSSEDLWNHLKSLLLDGMTEDNRGDWHVDHKIPVIEFIERGIDDPAIINSLDNLIPMWSNHNLSKNRRNLSDWLHELGEDSEEWAMYSRFL